MMDVVLVPLFPIKPPLHIHTYIQEIGRSILNGFNRQERHKRHLKHYSAVEALDERWTM